MKKMITSVLVITAAISLSACGRTVRSADSSRVTVQGAGDSAVGDIILADGSAVKADDFNSIDGANVPVAVVAEIKDHGTVLGVGVHRSEDPLQWAADGTAGGKEKFDGIVCTKEDAGDEKAASFTGDTDGSDNWDTICSVDQQGTEDAASNYPAFAFVNTYGDTWNLSGSLAFGWYVPSIEELYRVYENREVINASLRKIHELDNDAAMDGLGSNWYWSSSQSGTMDDYAWFVHYFNGYASDCPKNFENLHVLAVRVF